MVCKGHTLHGQACGEKGIVGSTLVMCERAGMRLPLALDGIGGELDFPLAEAVGVLLLGVSFPA